MNPRQRSTPNGVTVRGILSRGPAPAPSGGRSKASAEAPFPLPGPDPWGSVLLTSAPLSCWHLLYKAFSKCQQSFLYFPGFFTVKSLKMAAPGRECPSSAGLFSLIFCMVCPFGWEKCTTLLGKSPISGKVFDMGHRNATMKEYPSRVIAGAGKKGIRFFSAAPAIQLY